jgi:hypothetical protein
MAVALSRASAQGKQQRRKAMPKAATMIKKKATEAVPNVVTDQDNRDLIITPQQYEAITAANRESPINKLALRMFLHTNHLWHIAQAMQGKSKDVDPTKIDWSNVEAGCVRTLRASLPNLLKGIDPDVFAPEDQEESEYKRWERRSKIRNIGI